MSLSDFLVQKATLVLARLLLNPKAVFEDPLRKECTLDEPSILVVNHTGHLDGPILKTAFSKEKIHPLAAKDRFDEKGFGFFLRHTGCIPIDRQNPDLTWLHQSLDILHKDGESVAIFPEGQHGSHRSQLPFHPGVVMLAALALVPVVMVYIDGPYTLGRRNARMMVSRPFRLAPPEKGVNSHYIKEQTGVLQARMAELMHEFIELDDKR